MDKLLTTKIDLIEFQKLSMKDQLKKMLEVEKELRLNDTVLQLMHHYTMIGKDWIDVAELVQISVVQMFGFPESFLSVLRTAHLEYPELAGIPIQVINNISKKGNLNVGDLAPDTKVITIDNKEKSLLEYHQKGRKLVLIGLSRT
jgi:hypothetical protein